MPSFRADIQALRAIAVLLVLAFHVWPAQLPGGYVGVDVFFVISGYLITGHLLREVQATGRVHLPTFYARRARRLLPAASLTLVAVGLATYLWMPVFTWASIAADITASSLYVENWALQRRSVDYLAQDAAPSPLQHFWSLAVEEQFYLGWPLVLTVAARWRRRTSADRKPALPELLSPSRRAYALPMAAVSCLSFACAIYYARVSPTAGYFLTHVRLFELGAGGLLGVWAAGEGPVLPPWLASCWPRTLTAAAGLAAIGASGFAYTTDTPFPGTAALVPVLGAAAFIAAGEGMDGDGIDTPAHALMHFLSHPWLQYIGEVSYSLYLAHWPVLVVYPFATGRAANGALADEVTILVLSWALAHACKCGWEDRFRTMTCCDDENQQRSVLLCSSGRLTACLMTGGLLAASVLNYASLHHASSVVGAGDATNAISANLFCAVELNTSLTINSLYLGAEAVVKDAVHTKHAPLCKLGLSKVLPRIEGAFKDTPPAYKHKPGCYSNSPDLHFCDSNGTSRTMNQLRLPFRCLRRWVERKMLQNRGESGGAPGTCKQTHDQTRTPTFSGV